MTELKSILKPTLPPAASPSRADRNRDLALYHAHLIQQRKDVEAIIIAAIENLIDFPQSPASKTDRPTPKDAAGAKELLKDFQPSDYDSLIEERNINGKCGYILCPLPHRVENTSARFRIVHGQQKGDELLKVVEKSKLEQWCSEECARKALYIRVQLSEIPAWSRTGGVGREIELYGEGRSDATSPKPSEAEIMDVANKMQQLSIERGKNGVDEIAFDLMKINIQERARSSNHSTVLVPHSHLSEHLH